jgi:hypothetical protein
MLTSMFLNYFFVKKKEENAFKKSESTIKKSEILSVANNCSTKSQIYLSGVEMIAEGCFIHVKRDHKFQPTQLYISNSARSNPVNYYSLLSETEYSDVGNVKSYKQQRDDFKASVSYNYIEGKVDLNFLSDNLFNSRNLPFIGKGITTIHDFKQVFPYAVNSNEDDTLFFEIKNGNVVKVSTIQHVLYEYTYDTHCYFGKGIIYDFFSTEFDLQWWLIPEFIPKNNITSIKRYSYKNEGVLSTDEDEIFEQNFTYDYNQHGYPVQIKMCGEERMKFHYIQN